MTALHFSSFPRVGTFRKLRLAQEKYWRKGLSEQELPDTAKGLHEKDWKRQAATDADFIAAAGFTFYDHVLDLQIATGAVPARFGFNSQKLALEQYFQLARDNGSQFAIEMTKWFDTSYHYLMPEFHADTEFKANPAHYVQQLKEVQALSLKAKPTMVGPPTFLWLDKERGSALNRLDLLPKLLPVYTELLDTLIEAGAEWIQIDEPALTLDLPEEWVAAYQNVYAALSKVNAKILLSTYFGSVAEHASLLKSLPIDGLHIDLVRTPEQLAAFTDYDKVLSAGIIDNRNIQRTDLDKALVVLEPLKAKLDDRLWTSSSCLLLHTPYDLSVEEKLKTNKPGLYSWLAFTLQKTQELKVLKAALSDGHEAVAAELAASRATTGSCANNSEIHHAGVAKHLADLPANANQRKSPFADRVKAQQAWLNLSPLPTTSVDSFPQTTEIHQARTAFKKGELSAADYEVAMKKEIVYMVEEQEKLDLDVLVHGEAERNDMVEYFGELLSGFAFAQYGWVQSYGSHCVKPPIILGDISHPEAMTVAWSTYAQNLTRRPMRDMLTGPVATLQWSFVRNDIPRVTVCKQIALALNDEVLDLEEVGIKVVQINEPAIREDLPLKCTDWDTYLNWVGEAFRLPSAGCEGGTQIHTHMCYSEFNDILPAITALDADVITTEISRSDMELLATFGDSKYPNGIDPGVYGTHSPRIPAEAEIEHLLRRALGVIPAARLWINPDCGLKTHGWPEAVAAPENMVKITKKLRAKLARQLAVG